MYKKIYALKRHADKVTHSLPMLSLKTDDEVAQIRKFALIYYKPILS